MDQVTLKMEQSDKILEVSRETRTEDVLKSTLTIPEIYSMNSPQINDTSQMDEMSIIGYVVFLNDIFDGYRQLYSKWSIRAEFEKGLLTNLDKLNEHLTLQKISIKHEWLIIFRRVHRIIIQLIDNLTRQFRICNTSITSISDGLICIKEAAKIMFTVTHYLSGKLNHLCDNILNVFNLTSGNNLPNLHIDRLADVLRNSLEILNQYDQLVGEIDGALTSYYYYIKDIPRKSTSKSLLCKFYLIRQSDHSSPLRCTRETCNFAHTYEDLIWNMQPSFPYLKPRTQPNLPFEKPRGSGDFKSSPRKSPSEEIYSRDNLASFEMDRRPTYSKSRRSGSRENPRDFIQGKSTGRLELTDESRVESFGKNKDKFDRKLGERKREREDC